MRVHTLLFSTLFAVFVVAIPQNYERPNQAGSWDSQGSDSNWAGKEEQGHGSWPTQSWPSRPTASWSGRPTWTGNPWPTQSVTRGPWSGPQPTDWPGNGGGHEHGGSWGHENGGEGQGEHQGDSEEGAHAWGGEEQSHQGWKRARVNTEGRVLEI